MLPLSAALLAQATGAMLDHARRYCDPLNDAMAECGIVRPQPIAAFVATLAIESSRFTRLEEDLFYTTPERLRAVFPSKFKSIQAARAYVRRPDLVSRIVYQGYHGRGLIQITGIKNYVWMSQLTGVDYVADPDKLLRPVDASRTAALFFSKRGCIEAADRGDVDAVTRLVNGPAMMHAAERARAYHAALTILDFVNPGSTA